MYLTTLALHGAGSRDTTVIVWDVSLGAVAAQARSRTRSLGGGSSAGDGWFPMVCAQRCESPPARGAHGSACGLLIAACQPSFACQAFSTEL